MRPSLGPWMGSTCQADWGTRSPPTSGPTFQFAPQEAPTTGLTL